VRGGSKLLEVFQAGLALGHHYLGQRIGNHTAFGQHANETVRRRGRTSGAVNVRTVEAVLAPAPVAVAAAAGHAPIRQFEDRHRIYRRLQIETDRLHLLTMYPDIPAGINDSSDSTPFAQTLHGSIDGIAFRNPPKVDPKRTMKCDATIRTQIDIPPTTLRQRKCGRRSGQHAPFNQFGAHRNIEAAPGVRGDRHRPLQNFECVGVHLYWPAASLPIQPAYVAVCLVEAHQSMDGPYFPKRSMDCLMCA